jgi:phosphoribosylformylglycinamidine (FGAM) synthase PurS component
MRPVEMETGMPKFAATLRVGRLPRALDPEAQAIEKVLIQLGFPILEKSLKQWREIDIILEADDETSVRTGLRMFLDSRVNPSLDVGEITSVRPAD